MTIPARLVEAISDRYRIEREIGAGGMATVYLAEDVRHRRKVAMKVLRPELSAVIGSERFLKEVELTANLQHPHILPLFDSGSADGLLYYVMPFVVGETLRGRLDRERQLPVDDAIRIATEAADALEYAHRHGVVHRDIKPENILLHDGRPLLADFGIALAVQEAGGIRMTQTGMSLGTPQYMAPEQAMGDKAVDHRADIYGLGAVTYEMLAGEPPFTGPSSQAIVAKVMTEEPKGLTIQRRTVPEGVESAVLTALQKLPADRFRSAADFARALTIGSVAQQAPQMRRRAVRRPWLVPGLAALALLAVGAAYWLGTRSAGAGGPDITFGRATPVTWDQGLEIHPAISPDGRFVAYAAGAAAIRPRVFVRPVAGGRPVPLVADSTDAQSGPKWSPDGTRILFLSPGGVFSAPAFGGPLQPEVPPRPDGVSWAAWSPDGRSVGFTTGDSVFIRDEAGRQRQLARVFEPGLCSWSPNGRSIACASGNVQYAFSGQQFGNLSPSQLLLVHVADGTVDTLTDRSAANQSPIWLDDRRLLFVSNRHGPRDIYLLEPGRGGEPRRITTGLDAQTISLSSDGRSLAYSAASLVSNTWSVPIPASGSASPYSGTQVTFGNQLVESFSVSSDGNWLVYDSDLSGNADVYRVRLTGGEPERITTDPADDFLPTMSPDGREVAFHSWRSGNREIYVQPLDGRPVQQVTTTPDRQEVNAKWSPDGKALAFFEFEGAFDTLARGAVWISRRRPDGTWDAPVRRIQYGNWVDWSPDGSRIYYAHGSIANRIYSAPAVEGESTLLYDASVTGGARAEQIVVSRDGRTLYFKSHDESGRASIWAVPAAGGGRARRVLFFDDPARGSSRFNIALDAQRLYYGIDEKRSDIWVMELGSGLR